MLNREIFLQILCCMMYVDKFYFTTGACLHKFVCVVDTFIYLFIAQFKSIMAFNSHMYRTT